MRTRELNNMTGAEVREYLSRGDLIFVPVGTVETHGTFPIDVETTMPEAMAKILAEQSDGLYLTGLPYFFCGATTEARCSVQMSIGAGLRYLKALSVSLARQGFRRQLYIGGHGPTFVTLSALANDVFRETGATIAFFDTFRRPKKQTGKEVPFFSDDMFRRINYRTVGAYRVLDRLDEIIINPAMKDEDAFDHVVMSDDETQAYNYIFKFGPMSGQVGFYQNRPMCHGSFYGSVRSAEELEEISLAGEQELRQSLADLDVDTYLQDLDRLTEHNRSMIASHPHLQHTKE